MSIKNCISYPTAVLDRASVKEVRPYDTFRFERANANVTQPSGGNGTTTHVILRFSRRKRVSTIHFKTFVFARHHPRASLQVRFLVDP